MHVRGDRLEINLTDCLRDLLRPVGKNGDTEIIFFTNNWFDYPCLWGFLKEKKKERDREKNRRLYDCQNN